MAASWGARVTAGRGSLALELALALAAVGEMAAGVEAAPADPGEDEVVAVVVVVAVVLKLGTRFLGTYEAECRFLWRARRSARTNFCSHWPLGVSRPSTQYSYLPLGGTKGGYVGR